MFEQNAFVRGEDSTVTVLCKHTEMGQGTYTGLPNHCCRRAGCRLVADSGRRRASQYQALQQPALGQSAGNRQQHCHREFLCAATPSGGDGTGDVGGCCGHETVERSETITISKGVTFHTRPAAKASFRELAKALRRPASSARCEAKRSQAGVCLIGKRFPRTDSVAKTNDRRSPQDLRSCRNADCGGFTSSAFLAKAKSFDPSRAKRHLGGCGGADSVRIAVVAKDFECEKDAMR